MRSKIVADGYDRLLWAQKAVAAKAIEKKQAAELTRAGPDERKEIYDHLMAESKRHEKMANHKPSAGALW